MNPRNNILLVQVLGAGLLSLPVEVTAAGKGPSTPSPRAGQAVERDEGYGFATLNDPNLAPVHHRLSENLAYTQAGPTVPARLAAWSRQMVKTIYEPVKGRVYAAVGWQLATTTMVVGNDGVIIIDPGENDDAAAEIMREFRTITQKPIRAVVYTHRHPDHAFGTKGLGVTDEAVGRGEVQIFADARFLEMLVNDAGIVAPILSIRTAYGAAALLEPGPQGLVNGGIGPTFRSGHISFLPPTHVVADREDVEVAGVRMHLFHAYGDAEDELAVWFPDLAHLHGSETIQGETFPNLYSLRGTRYRDLVQWYQGVDRLLDFAPMARSYSGSHMRPWVGTDFIVERLRNYRDAIQFVHDQAVRYINKGLTPEELASAIQLPPHLAADPWLQEFYGSFAHSVRAVYYGYIGYFQGDITMLAAPPSAQKSTLYVKAMGGRSNVLALARAAIERGDYGWAMELLTHPIRVNHQDMEARGLKAEAMRRFASTQDNIFFRNFALSGAAELDGTLRSSGIWEFAAPEIIKALPADAIIDGLRVRLAAERALDANVTVGFRFTDTGEDSALTIRRGVAVFSPTLPAHVDGLLETDRATLNQILGGGQTIAGALQAGKIRTDAPSTVETFLGYFDLRRAEPVNLITR